MSEKVITEDSVLTLIKKRKISVSKGAQRANTQTRLIHSGTVLIFAKERGFIQSVKPALDKMRQRGVWIKDEDYARILTVASV